MVRGHSKSGRRLQVSISMSPQLHLLWVFNTYVQYHAAPPDLEADTSGDVIASQRLPRWKNRDRWSHWRAPEPWASVLVSRYEGRLQNNK